MIQVQNISKTYNEIKALQDVTFDVNVGEIFGLIGPDGAGKTSLLRIITSLLLPSGGRVKVFDYDVEKNYRIIRRITGYMPGRFSLYTDLSVLENLEFFATVFGTTIRENYELIKDIYSQIEPFKDRLAGKLSGGMKQKLALSCALIHRPRVLVLDEPTTGVDAVSRKEFWELLKDLKQKGITIIVSTPYMDEAQLCDRVALIQHGQILSVDNPANIVQDHDKYLFSIQSKDTYKLLIDLRAFKYTLHVFAFGNKVHLTTQTKLTIQIIHSYLISNGHDSPHIKKIIPDIEDIFIDKMYAAKSTDE